MIKANRRQHPAPAGPESAKPFLDELAALLAARWLAEKRDAAKAKPESGA